MSASSWVKDLQDRVKRASNDVNIVLQPRVAQAKRSLEASIQQMGLKPGPEIFDGDDALYVALVDLDALRDALTSLAASVSQHRTRLLDLARSQSALSSLLQQPQPQHHRPPPPQRQRSSPEINGNELSTDESDDHLPPTLNSLSGLAAGLTGGADSIAPADALLPLLRAHVPSAHVDTQLTLATAQTMSAHAMSRFALDMSTPMADLSRTFEEAFVSKITPLKKRYIAQKTEYLRYSKQAAAADDSLRRDHLESIAQSALPTSKATSETLLSEATSLLKYTLSNLSEWTLNVAQAQRDMFAHSAAAFEQPAEQAEKAQSAFSPLAS